MYTKSREPVSVQFADPSTLWGSFAERPNDPDSYLHYKRRQICTKNLGKVQELKARGIAKHGEILLEAIGLSLFVLYEKL